MSTTRQGIGIRTAGLHHVSLRCTDLARARQFYLQTLGFPLLAEKENAFLFTAGNTVFGVQEPADGTGAGAGDRFNPFRVGLDHLALGCDDEAELGRVTRALAEAGVENTGMKTDPTLGKRYVAFKDPDGIAWELYMA